MCPQCATPNGQFIVQYLFIDSELDAQLNEMKHDIFCSMWIRKKKINFINILGFFFVFNDARLQHKILFDFQKGITLCIQYTAKSDTSAHNEVYKHNFVNCKPDKNDPKRINLR